MSGTAAPRSSARSGTNLGREISGTSASGYGLPGVHCVSFPLTGPTPGVQSCGRMALLAGLGGHELAGEHDGGAPAGARPGRRLLERVDLELHCLLLCAECFT